MPTLKRIHVNRNVLASNKKHGRNHPGLGVEERGIRKRYGHRVDILHEGRVIAEGDMDKVQNDPQVVEVYLGE